MQDWLRTKLDGLVEAYLSQEVWSVGFEIQFLAYLDAFAHARGTGEGFWQIYAQLQKEHTREGDKPKALAFLIHDKKKLVQALTQFRQKFEGPRKIVMKTPKTPQESKERAPHPDPSALSIFEILSEIED